MACILVVDDDVDTVEALRAILVDEGFEVRTAGDGHEAIGQLTGAGSLALILLDCLMPGMDGGELLDFIAARSELDDIPIALMSADSHPPQHERAAAVLRKPFAIDELLRITRALLGSRGGSRPAASLAIVSGPRPGT